MTIVSGRDGKSGLPKGESGFAPLGAGGRATFPKGCPGLKRAIDMITPGPFHHSESPPDRAF
ncbi:MAG: hypothetical protein CM15mP125_0350 [Gammaproteobacteria bacterium]|nr:MAG: hypothetical protein CM15mP125_0350 [Gammaproteobacteria bacterium]